MLPVAFLLGCSGAAPSGDSGTKDTADTGLPAVSIAIAWGDTALTVSITNATVPGFRFGLAETGVGSTGWYGEDCLDGTPPYHLCHTFTGAEGTLTYVKTKGAVVEGKTTFFDPTKSADVTYYAGIDGGDCFVLGNDPAYYGSFDCLTLTAS